MTLTISQQSSTNRILHAAKMSAPGPDLSGFWETLRVEIGRGYSNQTYARTQRLNSVYVHQVYYIPGPFDLKAFGPDSALAAPSSTYSVYCGVDGMADNAFESLETCIKAVLATNPFANRKAMSRGTFNVWSPDGEGSLFVEFKDEDVEAALAFADSLNGSVEAAN